jgi:GT2 family glycosyltransferase
MPDPVLPVAVAVVSFDTRSHLAACLASLGDAAEVWVVDNGSTDGSPDLVRAAFPHVRLVEPGENLGYGRAVNLVAARTAQPWVVAANADVVAAPGALARLVAAGAADPLAGAVAPRLVLPDGTDQVAEYPFPGVRQALGRPGPERWSVAAFLLLRRAALLEVGGFDPRQFLFAEDLDLGWRLTRRGWRTLVVPDAVVHHDESAATAGPERTERWLTATYAWLAPPARRAAGLVRRRDQRRGRPARAAPRPETALWWARLHRRAALRARASARAPSR